MTYLSLFSGVGGGDLGMQHLCGLRCVGYVEINEHCQRAISQRIRDGLLDNAPIFNDVRSFVRDGYAGKYRGMVDLVCGGDPCQANSNAQRNGSSVESLAEWFLEVVRTSMPRRVERENPSKTKRDAPWPGARFADSLESMGYSATCVTVRACCLGCDHQREKMLVLAELADTNGEHVTQRVPFRGDCQAPKASIPRGVLAVNRTPTASRVRRASHDVARRMERLRAIGNGQVPSLMAVGWRLLSGE